MAGLTARMWQAKCYEEKGELGPAMGIYNELMEHHDPRLRPLQRYVGYFRIIALGKRKEYRPGRRRGRPLARGQQAARGAALEGGPRRPARAGQEHHRPAPRARGRGRPRPRRPSGSPTRSRRSSAYSSPFKTEALELLKKYKPSAAANAAEDVAKLTYDDAAAAGRAGHRLPGVGPGDPAAPPGRSARPRPRQRHRQGQLRPLQPRVLLLHGQAVLRGRVLAEHLARRYPQGGLSPKAAEIGMASLGRRVQHLHRDRPRRPTSTT